MDHPFWTSSFPVKQASQVRALIDAGITEVWIDTDKGLDVPDGEAADPAAVEQQLTFAATSPLPLIELPATDAGRYAPSAPAKRAGPSPMQIRADAKKMMSELYAEARMGRAIDVQACEPMVEQIVEAVSENSGALLNVLRIKHRDEYTYMHSVAVCALMVALSRTLGFNERQAHEAGLAGLLHDIGKAVVPLDILVKPARLTDEEFRKMRGHAAAGHALLRGARVENPMALDVCLNHHEKIDGSGYPRQLSGDEISLFAKMGSVCDVYDAVTSNRPYKAGWDPAEAVREMAQWKGHFDPKVFQAFVKTVGIYPVGSLVRLQSQRLAMVVALHRDDLLKPVVQPLYVITTGRRVENAAWLDLREPGCGDSVVGVERPADWARKGVSLPELSTPL
jgi:HD-GYP domain-containing protein (c-di-GMP phosphodiesterase class II)